MWVILYTKKGGTYYVLSRHTESTGQNLTLCVYENPETEGKLFNLIKNKNKNFSQQYAYWHETECFFSVGTG